MSMDCACAGPRVLVSTEAHATIATAMRTTTMPNAVLQGIRAVFLNLEFNY